MPEQRTAREWPPRDPEDGRPVLPARTGDIHVRLFGSKREKGIAHALAIENGNTRLGLHGGRLVRVELAVDEGSRPALHDLNVASLLAEMHKRIRPIKIEGEKVKPTTFAKEEAQAILATPPERLTPFFPVIDAIAEAPFMRADGSICTAPGYDSASRVWLVLSDGIRFPRIPASPAESDAIEARELIEDVIADFPFDGQASRANMLAAILTPAVRQFVGCTPIGVVSGPVQGTGKSLGIRLLSRIHTGRDPSLVELSDNADEMSKRITAALATGASVVLVDNVKGQLSNASLEIAVTTETWSARRLGRNDDTIEVPQRASFFATGNNISASRDIARRSYWVRLDARVARPWERTNFRHPDLIGYIDEHRGKLLAATLVMCRAWFIAGCPTPQTNAPALGGFEGWQRTVGGILAFAGVRGFLENAPAMIDAADPTEAEWDELAAHWDEKIGDAPVTVATLEDHCLMGGWGEYLPGALRGYSERPGFRRRLGDALRARKDTVTPSGFRIEQGEPDRKRKVATWRVVAPPREKQAEMEYGA